MDRRVLKLLTSMFAKETDVAKKNGFCHLSTSTCQNPTSALDFIVENV